MTSRDYAFWLQGFFEISGAEELTKEQTAQIKKHLNLVFKHEIDPSMGNQEHQDKLNLIHSESTLKPKPFDHNYKDEDGILLRC